MKPIIETQKAYYRARASEYDEWFERRGRYDRGPELKAAWETEVREVRRALGRVAPFGDVLELAAGTGIWTRELLPRARSVTVVDASQEMLALNRAAVASLPDTPRGRYEAIHADIFSFVPTRTYDFIFFGFWLSHVPDAHFLPFCRMVHQALAPGGRGFLVDSRLQPTALAEGHPVPTDEIAERHLNDGRVFQIVKRFYDPEELREALGATNLEAEIASTPSFFIYGTFRHAADRPASDGS